MISLAPCRLILTGAGNVGQSLMGIVQSQEALLRERYGIVLRVVGVADSGGAAVSAAGLDMAVLLEAKRAGRSVATLPGVGVAGMDGAALVGAIDADLLMEATPVNLQHGQPGLGIVRAALARGLHVVLANKAPLVLAYAELARRGNPGGPQPLSAEQRPALRFSACVGGALPTINIGRRDLAGSRIMRVEAVLNGTTQSILRAMERGVEFAEALADAQRRGLAETNADLDIDGWDAANKLVILANAVLRQPTTLADLKVQGIRGLVSSDLAAALAHEQRVVLLCLAELEGERYRLSVQPTALPLDHPLGRMSGDEMGVVYHTDIAGRSSAFSAERGPEPTAAAMLRDAIEIMSGR